MTAVRHPGACSVLSPNTTCSCGEKYKRAKHPVYPFTYPLCDQCGEVPSVLSLQRMVNHQWMEFRYSTKGHKIKTLDDAYKLSMEIYFDIETGTFCKSKYKKRSGLSISDTISDLIEEMILPKQRELRISVDDTCYIREFMAPFFSEVGVFTASKIHLWKFIETFRLKGSDKERAEKLFNLILDQIKL